MLLYTDPGAPTNLTVRQISNWRLHITWNPPSSNFSAAVSYYFYERTHDYITNGTITNITNITTSSLSNGSSYSIHVRASTGTYLSEPATSETIVLTGKLRNIVPLLGQCQFLTHCSYGLVFHLVMCLCSTKG